MFTFFLLVEKEAFDLNTLEEEWSVIWINWGHSSFVPSLNRANMYIQQ